MSWKKTIPEKEVTIDIEHVCISKRGIISAVYKKDNKRERVSVDANNLSDTTKKQMEDIVYDCIKHNLVDIDSFSFDDEEETEPDEISK